MGEPVVDGLRLAVGTLTVLPCPPPRRVGRESGAWAMTLAPLVGLVLAALAAAFLWLLALLPPVPPAVAALLVVGLLALLTRAIHLDGLADTADGLGSGKPAEAALAVMRRGDIGPFGVVALVLVLGLQVAALAALIAGGEGAFSLALALVASRLLLPFLCARGVPAARPDGLGRTVAGTVAPAQLLLSVALAAGALALVAVLAPQDPHAVLLAGLMSLVGPVAGGALGWWCVRRLGGATGDVLGACVETATTAALLALVILPGSAGA
jgi:adenosylcobinamide-GDP ribazoletransferase